MWSYNIEAPAPSTTIPAPSAASLSAAPFATVIVKSSTSKFVTLVEFISPVIFRSPSIDTLPLKTDGEKVEATVIPELKVPSTYSVQKINLNIEGVCQRCNG